MSPSARKACLAALSAMFVAVFSASAQTAEAGRPPLVIGHRGGAGLAPENTLAAFRTGVAAGADGVELDVHLSGDGRLVVMHDALVSRTTDGSGYISDLAFAELKKLDASFLYQGPGVYGRQEIPSLEEALETIRGAGSTVQIEIKVRADGSRYPGIEEKVLAALSDRGMSRRASVISFDYPTLETVKELDPGMPVCALVGSKQLRAFGARAPAEAAAAIAGLGFECAGVEEKLLSDGLFAALKKAGLKVGVWTVNDRDKMRRFAGLGVDFITTNRPDLLREILKR